MTQVTSPQIYSIDLKNTYSGYYHSFQWGSSGSSIWDRNNANECKMKADIAKSDNEYKAQVDKDNTEIFKSCIENFASVATGVATLVGACVQIHSLVKGDDKSGGTSGASGTSASDCTSAAMKGLEETDPKKLTANIQTATKQVEKNKEQITQNGETLKTQTAQIEKLQAGPKTEGSVLYYKAESDKAETTAKESDKAIGTAEGTLRTAKEAYDNDKDHKNSAITQAYTEAQKTVKDAKRKAADDNRAAATAKSAYTSAQKSLTALIQSRLDNAHANEALSNQTSQLEGQIKEAQSRANVASDAGTTADKTEVPKGSGAQPKTVKAQIGDKDVNLTVNDDDATKAKDADGNNYTKKGDNWTADAPEVAANPATPATAPAKDAASAKTTQADLNKLPQGGAFQNNGISYSKTNDSSGNVFMKNGDPTNLVSLTADTQGNITETPVAKKADAPQQSNTQQPVASPKTYPQSLKATGRSSDFRTIESKVGTLHRVGKQGTLYETADGKARYNYFRKSGTLTQQV